MKKSYNILSAFIISLMGVGLMSVNSAHIKSDNHLIVRDVLRANATNNSGTIVNELDAPAQGNKVSAVKAQVSDVKDDKISIRFVAGIDTFTYDYAAFTITLKDENKENVQTKTLTYQVTSAYHSVVAGGATKTATEVFGEGYNYLIAYTITGVPKAYWNYYYDVTASIGSDAEHVTTGAASELKNIIRYSDVKLDGKMDDPIWTDTVKSNKYSLGVLDASAYYNLYASRNIKGIYFYADYYTKANGAASANWWQGNNFEFRINSPEYVLINPKEPENNKHQYWISNYKASGSNMTDQYISEPTLNSDGYFEVKFEAFIAYSDMLDGERKAIDESTPVGFSTGFNPAGKGWVPGEAFATINFFETAKITTDGIVRYYDESFHCSESHEYGNYSIVSNSSCAADGLEHRLCKWCNHEDKKVIPKGEHDYNETAEIISTSTCITAGVTHIGCTACDAYKVASLPLNPRVHESNATYTDGKWSCCGSTIENSISFDNLSNSYGWGDQSKWINLASNVAGDFTATVDLFYKTNGAKIDEGAGWHTLLPIITHDVDSARKSVWVSRMDWYGWCDDWGGGLLTPEVRNTGGGKVPDNKCDGWFYENGNRASNATVSNIQNEGVDVRWTCSRKGTVITHDFIITDQAGIKYHFYFKANDVDTTKNIGISLTGEFTAATVYSFVLK